MQHSESRPSIEILFSSRADELALSAFWFAFAAFVVALLFVLTYALAHAIYTSWVFVS